MDAIPITGPYVPFLIDLNTIRYARVGIREYTSIRKGLSSRVDVIRIAVNTKSNMGAEALSGFFENLHCRRLSLVVAKKTGCSSSICATIFWRY
jgi:hypothetical protein